MLKEILISGTPLRAPSISSGTPDTVGTYVKKGLRKRLRETIETEKRES